MGDDEIAHPDVPARAALPAVVRSDAARESAPIDGQFRVVWAPWRRVRLYWWALGPYLAYCAILWGLAALAGWAL